MRTLSLISLAAIGCSSQMPEDVVRKTIEDAFLAENPAGRIGWELVGKGQWFEGTSFSKGCLIDREFAYPNFDTVGQLTPSILGQTYLVSSTQRGFCIDLGREARLVIDSIEPVSEMSQGWDIQNITAHFEVDDPTPWFECLNEDVRSRSFYVEDKNGTPTVNDLSQVRLTSNNCTGNTTKAESRKSGSRPTATPPKAPTMDQVKSLTTKLDEALYNADFDKVMDMTSCVNVLDPEQDEEAKWGYCTLGDFVNLGPSTKGQQRLQDGPPWLEGTVYKFDSFEKIQADRGDPTLFHVLMTHRRSKESRSFTVQWADEQWKMFGVYSVISQGVSAIRFMNDFHDKAKKDIFDRRLKGEKIDHKGNPLPGTEYDDVEFVGDKK